MFLCPSILVCMFQWIPDTCGPLSPVERHTNSNCLECLAHGRVCFRGFMQEQVISRRTTTVIRTRCIFAELLGRIRINYSDRTEYEQNIQYSPSDYHHHTSFIDDINDSLLVISLKVIFASCYRCYRPWYVCLSVTFVHCAQNGRKYWYNFLHTKASCLSQITLKFGLHWLSISSLNFGQKNCWIKHRRHSMANCGRMLRDSALLAMDIHVVQGRPGGLLQFSKGKLLIFSASVSSVIRAMCLNREKRRAWTIAQRCGCLVVQCPSHLIILHMVDNFFKSLTVFYP